MKRTFTFIILTFIFFLQVFSLQAEDALTLLQESSSEMGDFYISKGYFWFNRGCFVKSIVSQIDLSMFWLFEFLVNIRLCNTSAIITK